MLIRMRMFGGCLALSILAACNTTNQPEQIEMPTYPIPDAQQFPEYAEPKIIEQVTAEPDVNASAAADADAAPVTTPTSSKSSDTIWVQEQSPTQYTLLIAADTSAAHVAMALQNAPKTARMAEVKTSSHGAINYLGVYGIFKINVIALFIFWLSLLFSAKAIFLNQNTYIIKLCS